MSTQYLRYNPTSGAFNESTVRRLCRSTVKDIVRHRGIPILYCTVRNEASLSLVQFKPLQQLSIQQSTRLDLVWHTGWFFDDDEKPRPGWNGFMQSVCVETFAFCSWYTNVTHYGHEF